MVVLENVGDESDTLFRQGRLFQQPIFNLTKAEKKEERDSLTHSTHTSSKTCQPFKPATIIKSHL